MNMHINNVGGFLESGKVTAIKTACAVLKNNEIKAEVLPSLRNECISAIPEMTTSAFKSGLPIQIHHITDVL